MRLRLALPAATLAAIVLFALFGDLLTPFRPDQSSLLDRNRPPVLMGGDWTHPLGTDGLGRDLLARLVLGTRISIGLALVGTAVGLLIGTTLGLLAARGRRAIDGAILAIVDIQASIPFLIVALAALAIFGNSLALFVAILGVYGWETYARLVRSSALSFVQAARAVKVPTLTIDRRHILPTVANVIIVRATLNFPQRSYWRLASAFSASASASSRRSPVSANTSATAVTASPAHRGSR